MTISIALLVVIAVLIASGVYLILERSLTRILVGVVLIGNGVNLLFLVAAGPPGGAPIVGQTPIDEMSDPLPQAMVLTAIVITLGMTAFLLAMAYRSWQLNRNDDVADDVEDRRIARVVEKRALSEATADDDDDDDDDTDSDSDDEGLRYTDEVDSSDEFFGDDQDDEPVSSEVEAGLETAPNSAPEPDDPGPAVPDGDSDSETNPDSEEGNRP